MSKEEYLITDTPLKALTVFAMPMILGSFFQQVYNMADSIIVGQFVGSSALAAVGACAALTNVFICVALGAGVGAGVLVSRYFGAREYGKMKTIVSTSLISFLVLSILLGVFGFWFSHGMMRGLQTPADILKEAVLYLRVYFVGFPFLFMYNILSTMFTAIGESKIPLGLLIFSSILNIGMDLWMVAGLGLGVFGAALATLIAQGISAVLSFLIFFNRMRRYQSTFSWFDGRELCSMLQIAVPVSYTHLLRHPQSCQQFIHGKRLRQVIVRPGIQRPDFIGILCPGADYNDRHIRPRTDLLDDLHAIHIWKSQIKQHNIWIVRQRLHYGACAVLRRKIPVFVSFQRRSDQIAHRGIIFYNKDKWLIHLSSPH